MFLVLYCIHMVYQVIHHTHFCCTMCSNSFRSCVHLYTFNIIFPFWGRGGGQGAPFLLLIHLSVSLFYFFYFFYFHLVFLPTFTYCVYYFRFSVVDSSYDGPRLEDNGQVTMEFCEAMLKRFEEQKLIHKK